jgi:uncharacterized metal-binding protein YceD (DUF177 family)
MSSPTPEFSRPVDVASVGRSPRTLTIEATADERTALARRFDLPAIERLSARLTVAPEAAGTAYAVTGSLSAEVVQECVVTFEPVRAEIEEPVEAVFGEAPADVLGEEVDVDPLETTVEPIESGSIDLGELVAQHLLLALDPYPRAPGASLPATAVDDAADDAPFAALRALRREQS